MTTKLFFCIFPLSPPATIVATVYSCHFPFVSIFLDVIHVLCLNDMQAKNQIKDFKTKKKRYSLPSCHMRLSASYPYFQEAGKPSQRSVIFM